MGKLILISLSLELIILVAINLLYINSEDDDMRNLIKDLIDIHFELMEDNEWPVAEIDLRGYYTDEKVCQLIDESGYRVITESELIVFGTFLTLSREKVILEIINLLRKKIGKIEVINDFIEYIEKESNGDILDLSDSIPRFILKSSTTDAMRSLLLSLHTGDYHKCIYVMKNNSLNRRLIEQINGVKVMYIRLHH